MNQIETNHSWNLSRWSVLHSSFVLFLMLACSAAGISAYLRLGRAEDPTFTIKTAVVSAAWPGATPEEMQQFVAERVEEKLRETPNLDFLQTYCISDRMLTLVQLKDSARGKAAEDAWYQVRKKLDDIRSDLPSGVLGPAVNDEYGDVYSAIYAFTGDEYSYAELKRLCEMARTRLLRLDNIEKVDVIGEQEEQIFVEFSHRKLSTLGITPLQIFDSVQRQGAMLRSGSIDTDTDRIHVRVSRDFSGLEQLEAIPVEAAGKVFRLGDVAKVTRSYANPPLFKTRYNGKPCVSLGVVMQRGGNVLELGQAIEKEMEVVRSLTPIGVEIGTIAFQPHVVEESVGEFLNSFFEALVIVLVVSFLSLGFRTGIVVALSVPLVLAISLIIMEALGMNLDRITLGALILSLGLLVDDAIIAVEMMAVKMEEGWNRVDAATFAWTSTAFPMLSGTLITIAGFLPVGFAKSTSGEYAGGIFWVVGITLVVSWFVAVTFTPLLGVKLLPSHWKKSHDAASHAAAFQTPFHRVLRRLIQACVRRPWVVVGVTGAMFVAALFGFTRLQQQFFPTSSRTEVLVDVRMNEGASIAATERMAQQVEELLDPWLETESETGDVLHYATYVGAGAARFFLALNPDLPNPSFAKLVIQTRDVKARERVRAMLINTIDHNPAFADASVRVLRLEFGPPVGYPVQFRVVGPDPSEVRRISEQVREVMRRDPAAVDVNLEWDEPAKSIRVQLDQDRARLMGLSPTEIEQGLQTLLSGTPISQYREGTETIPIVAQAVPEERLNLSEFADMTLFTLSGRSVPIQQVGRIEYALEQPITWRRNQERVLTVRCDIADGNQAPDVSTRIDRQLSDIRASLPPGYRIDLGGAIEESTKANKALFQVFPLMIVVMLTLLMSQVHDFRKMLLIFGIAPLGLIGAVTALHLFNAPFGFVALLGVIALAGMDMRNSVILVDQIEQDRAQGLSEWDAVIESSVRRARPVILTAATAILAMIPLTRSVFWGPMAMAIMGGLSMATFLTLINLPAIYVMLFRVKAPE
ncbi:MAG: efflux RND transporter permease subunit [Pirellula sp.]|nr:efflux RND transporter permease subunit [Pirellula sp.]